MKKITLGALASLTGATFAIGALSTVSCSSHLNKRDLRLVFKGTNLLTSNYLFGDGTFVTNAAEGPFDPNGLPDASKNQLFRVSSNEEFIKKNVTVDKEGIIYYGENQDTGSHIEFDIADQVIISQLNTNGEKVDITFDHDTNLEGDDRSINGAHFKDIFDKDGFIGIKFHLKDTN
jgi:hypothetical protein